MRADGRGGDVVERISLRAGEPLRGDVQLARVLAEIPDGHTVTGMFFSRYVDALGSEFDALRPTLEAPPRLGRYLPFSMYPLRDYLRVLDRVARTKYAERSVREAYRRLARSEVDVFVASTLGRVTFSLLSTPDAALMKYPESFGVLAKGPRARAEALEGGGVRVVYEPYRGALEYAMGVLEGLVLAFDKTPSIEISVEASGDATFEVTWFDGLPPPSGRPPPSSSRSIPPPSSSRSIPPPPPRGSRKP